MGNCRLVKGLREGGGVGEGEGKRLEDFGCVTMK